MFEAALQHLAMELGQQPFPAPTAAEIQEQLREHDARMKRRLVDAVCARRIAQPGRFDEPPGHFDTVEFFEHNTRRALIGPGKTRSTNIILESRESLRQRALISRQSELPFGARLSTGAMS